LLPSKPLTHLQRAFKVFESMHLRHLSAGDLAVLLACDLAAAYDYIKRLKESGCIERKGVFRRAPTYGLVNGAEMPPDDRRGGARSRIRASRPISQITAARFKP
jgi:hypothetical protein